MPSPLRHLRTVADLPYVTKTGRAVVHGGYDEETQIYLHLPPLEWQPRVPVRPTREQVQHALRQMMRPWSAYRFATTSDAAGMVSAVLAAVCRGMLDLCPAYLFDAAQQASGKTKAARALGAVVEGTLPAATPFSGNGPGADDELRKRLVALACEGRRFTLIDNVIGHYRSPTLAAVLTSGRVEDRILGQSRTVRAESMSLVTLSSNNASVDADLSRRIVQVRIDAGVKPAHRAFAFDPVSVALSQRRQIAEAVCTVLAGYFGAGAPDVIAGDAGGFADWNRLARQPVLWLAREGLSEALGWELGDPAASMLADPADTDPEIESLGELLRALGALSEGQPFTSAQALEWFQAGERDSEGVFGQLRSAVADLIGRADVSVKSLGRALMYRRDRPVDGFKLLASGGGRVRTWRVVPVAGA